MKAIFLLPLLSMHLFVSRQPGTSPVMSPATADSAIILHTVDGLVNEWPEERFSTHQETKIRYAADNDANDLYFAISIPSPAIQAKVMQAGMTLFIDANGKKRESRGVEFPVINENSPALPNDRNYDVKAIGGRMVLNLIKLKFFGFSDDAPPYQELNVPGSVNVAYNWDSAEVLHIEYKLPLTFFGNASALNQKNISFGWKLQPVQNSANSGATTTSTQVVGFSRGNRPPARTSTPNTPVAGGRNFMNEVQQFWSKYVIVTSKQ